MRLHDAIEQAMQGPQAQAAAAQLEVARGQLRQAGLGPNPRLYLQSEDFRPWADDFSFTTQTENYAFLSQTVETDGKRRKRVESAQARLEQARAAEQLTLQQIAGRVAGAYWNAVILEQIATLLRQDKAAVDDMVRYHKERVDAGAMRGVDLLRMQLERDRILLALRSAERDAEQARLEIFKQMGRPPVATIVLTDSVDLLTPIAPVSVETVLVQRVDMIAARDAVTSAESDLKLQHAVGVPDFDLVGGYKRNSTTNTGYAALQIPLPLRNRNQGEILRAQASITLARAELAALEARVRADVLQNEANYKRESELVQQILPDMRREARENLRLMTEAYRIGGVDLLRYLDAERTAFDVEVNALRSLAEFQQAALRLQLSYGVRP